jgi:hypothetical protein
VLGKQKRRAGGGPRCRRPPRVFARRRGCCSKGAALSAAASLLLSRPLFLFLCGRLHSLVASGLDLVTKCVFCKAAAIEKRGGLFLLNRSLFTPFFCRSQPPPSSVLCCAGRGFTPSTRALFSPSLHPAPGSFGGVRACMRTRTLPPHCTPSCVALFVLFALSNTHSLSTPTPPQCPRNVQRAKSSSCGHRCGVRFFWSVTVPPALPSNTCQMLFLAPPAGAVLPQNGRRARLAPRGALPRPTQK